jgi:guanylate kinase
MDENVNFDNEVLAYLSTRKDQLIESHGDYISGHPEIRQVLNDFLSSVLLRKPDNVYVFSKEYFHPFNTAPEQKKPLVVVGPSGVGKKTLIKQVIDKYGDLFKVAKCFTTNKRCEEENPLVYKYIESFEPVSNCVIPII